MAQIIDFASAARRLEKARAAAKAAAEASGEAPPKPDPPKPPRAKAKKRSRHPIPLAGRESEPACDEAGASGLPRSEPRPPVRSADPPAPGRRSFVPVVTLAKGKFTLAVISEKGERYLSLYNTASKVEIARRRVGHTRRPQWVRWAELVAQAWQTART